MLMSKTPHFLARKSTLILFIPTLRENKSALAHTRAALDFTRAALDYTRAALVYRDFPETYAVLAGFISVRVHIYLCSR